MDRGHGRAARAPARGLGRSTSGSRSATTTSRTRDWAIFELRARDVLDHGVFVGPYSRFGWNHPGPLLFYVLAVPYKLLGSKSISMHITALLVNGATIAAIGWVAFRRGRLPMVVAALVPARAADRTRSAPTTCATRGTRTCRSSRCCCCSCSAGRSRSATSGCSRSRSRWRASRSRATSGSRSSRSRSSCVALVGIVGAGCPPPEGRRGTWWRGVAEGGRASRSACSRCSGSRCSGARSSARTATSSTSSSSSGDPHDTAGLNKALEVLGLQWGPRPEWIFGPARLRPARRPVHRDALVARRSACCWASRRRWSRSGAGRGHGVARGLRSRSGSRRAVVAVSNIVDIVFPYLTRWTWVLGAALGILVLRGRRLAIAARAPRRGAALGRAGRGRAPRRRLCAMETVDALDAGTPFARSRRRSGRSPARCSSTCRPAKGRCSSTSSHGGIVPRPGSRSRSSGTGSRGGHPEPGRRVRRRPRRRHGPYRAALVPVLGDRRRAEFTPTGRASRLRAPADRRPTGAIRSVPRRPSRSRRRTRPHDLVKDAPVQQLASARAAGGDRCTSSRSSRR